MNELSSAARWERLERLLAVGGVILIAARVDLRYLVTVGDVLALATVPVWLPAVRRYVGAPVLLVVGSLALVSGVFLTLLHSTDHRISPGGFLTDMSLLVSLLVSAGFLLWARERLSVGLLAALFGFGLLFGLPVHNPLFPGNPWKYGIGFAVSVLALGLAHAAGRRSMELVILAALALAAAVTDFRSMFAILALVAALVAWQARPTDRSRRGSAIRTLLGVVVVAMAIYNLAEAAILAGFLGEDARARTVRQLHDAGSLLLGGRPEIAATVGLMRHDILGLGPGVRANFDEIVAAKSAMASIGYDPDNGYVSHWMFGRGGAALHSTTGDLWARYGPVALLFVLVVLVVTVQRFGLLLATRNASGLQLLLCVFVLWSLFFEPFYSALPKLILLIGLVLRRREETGGPPDPPLAGVPAETQAGPQANG